MLVVTDWKNVGGVMEESTLIITPERYILEVRGYDFPSTSRIEYMSIRRLYKQEAEKFLADIIRSNITPPWGNIEEDSDLF